jgi:hypothetical protein
LPRRFPFRTARAYCACAAHDSAPLTYQSIDTLLEYTYVLWKAKRLEEKFLPNYSNWTYLAQSF